MSRPFFNTERLDMGRLTSLKIKRTKVALDENQSFEVRAVSTNDLMALVSEHGATLALVFSKLSNSESGAVTGDSVRDLIFDVAREFPDIAAAIIALAADEYTEDGMNFARDIPFTVQVEAIEAVFGLTFASEGSLKKLLESLTKMIVGVSGTLAKAELPSQIGTGD